MEDATPDIELGIKVEVDDTSFALDTDNDVKPDVKIESDGGGKRRKELGKVVFARKPPEYDDEDSESSSSGEETSDERMPSPFKVPGQDSRSGLGNYNDHWPADTLPEKIENKFIEALDNDACFSSSFLYQHSYNDAPNPVIDLDAYGHIGLPLNMTSGSTLLSHAQQKMDSEEELEGSPHSRPLSLDVSKVHFENPAWDQFLGETVQEACSRLGARTKRRKTACVLSQVLLCTSDVGWDIATEREDTRSFGTLVVILPSTSTGPVVTASFENLSTQIQPEATPGVQATRIFAAFCDVGLKLEPLSSGFAMVLSFSLVDTSSNPLPRLPSSDLLACTAALREAFSLWSQCDPLPTAKVVYKLKYQYTLAATVLHCLRAEDHSRATLVDYIAKEYGFQVGLARVESVHQGTLATDDYENMGSWRHMEGPGIPDPEMDERNSFDPTVLIRDLKTLGGDLISTHVYYDEAEVINMESYDSIGSTLAATEFGEGVLTEWYRDPILVIWPKAKLTEFKYGVSYLSHALRTLEDSHSERASPEEQVLLDYVLGLAPEFLGRHPQAASVLRRAACRWRDVSLWHRVMGWLSTGRGAHIEVQDCCLAIRTFGYENILSPYIRKILDRRSSNSFRLGFLDTMDEELADCDEGDRCWIHSEREYALHNLSEISKHSKGDELLLIVQAARHHGGATCFREMVLPQLEPHMTVTQCIALIDLVHEHTEDFQSDDDPECARLASRIQSYIKVDESDPNKSGDLVLLLMRRAATDSVESWEDVLARLISTPDNATPHHEHVQFMDNLLSKLPSSISQNGWDTSTGPLAPFFKHFVLAYTQRLKNSKPNADVLEAADALQSSHCACGRCNELARLFKTQREDVSLAQITDAQNQCLQKKLGKIEAVGLAKSEALAKRQRGLKVTKLELSKHLAEWLSLRGKVQAFLRAIWPQKGALEALIGESDHRTIVDVLRLQKTGEAEATGEPARKRRKV